MNTSLIGGSLKFPAEGQHKQRLGDRELHGFSEDVGEATVAGVGERGWTLPDKVREASGNQFMQHLAAMLRILPLMRGMGRHLNSGGSHQVSLWNRSLQTYVYFMQNMEFGAYSEQR